MKIIIGNWKMNSPSKYQAELIQKLQKNNTKNKIVLCVPFTSLSRKKTSVVHFGAQNVSQFTGGAFTGEISAKMIKETGAEYVIIGHSERRLYYKETLKQIRQKVENALNVNLIPIICIGETETEKANNETLKVIEKNLSVCVPITNKPIIIAYEPRWAIGTGKTPTKIEIKSVHEFIYKFFKTNHRPIPQIIYGGSITGQNAKQIASIKYVDGLLVGAASLKTETFLPIIEQVK
ncbi:MAG: triose-phosphate isomerase [Alphaproteobacteria bacterium]|nr:triose-phosphate isomerase [Alphaproteobacteria bacterium]